MKIASLLLVMTLTLAFLSFFNVVAAAARLHGSYHDSRAAPAARPAPSGYTSVHDPSSVVWEEASQRYYMYGTGLTSHVSVDGYNWTKGIVPLTESPAWVKTNVPLHTGGFWAPDVAFLNGLWHMYYTVSVWAGPISCIGVATTPSLASGNWTDSGAPVVCHIWSWTSRVTINAIDPHVFVDPRTNRKYLSYGSFHAGVYIIELGQLPGSPVVSQQLGDPVNVQRRIGDFMEGAEGSWVQPHNGAFWLFGNWGTCCVGVNSTYNIRIGSSVNPLGPYYDRDGLDMRFNGGTILLNVSGRQIGPGQIGFPNPSPAGGPGGNASAPIVSYHYYDGDNNGAPTLGQAEFLWDDGGWPSVRERL